MSTKKSKTNQHEDPMMQEILATRERMVLARDLIYKISFQLLEKLNGRVGELTIDEIKTSNLASAVKSTVESLNLAINVDHAALGLDRVIHEIKEIKKLSNSQ